MIERFESGRVETLDMDKSICLDGMKYCAIHHTDTGDSFIKFDHRIMDSGGMKLFIFLIDRHVLIIEGVHLSERVLKLMT